MGWTGSSNMYPSEVKLRFEDKNQAVKFAKKNKLEFFIQEYAEGEKTIKSYVNNYLE